MGNKGSRTHPESEEPPSYDYDYEYDQRDDYDSGWYPNKDYGTAYFEEKGAPVIKRKRSCTDVLCLLLLFVFLGGWGAMACFAFTMGDINRVVHPTDSEGNICGRGLMSDRPYLLMFDMTQCLNPAVLVEGCLTPQACVKTCPTETYSPLADITINTKSLAASFTNLLAGQSVVTTSEEAIKRKIGPYCRKTKFQEKVEELSVQELIDSGICPPWYLKSSPIFGLCLPITFEANSTRLLQRFSPAGVGVPVPRVDLERGRTRFGAFLAVRQFGERVFSDLKETYWMVGLALLGACVISFVWIILMRFLAGPLVYISILVVFLGIGCLLGYCAHTLYGVWQSTDPETHRRIYQLNWTPEILDDFLKQKDTWIAFTSILGIIFLIIVCLFIFLWQRIRIAIALIEQGSKAVGQMFSSLFFPVLPFLLQLVVLAWFLVVALFLSSWGTQEYRIALKSNSTSASSADRSCPCSWPNTTDFELQPGQLCLNDPSDLLPTDGAQNATCHQPCGHLECQFVKYTKNKDYSWMQFVNVFGLYWGLFFFTAFGELVLAGVFAEWYWTKDKSKLPSCALGSSLWNATIFHLGTVAFGSLIIAIIRMVRTVLAYIEKKCNKFNNDLTKCLLKCCQCCLWCLEKFMRFLNRNAYIMCAVKSSNFCKSAKDAFNLLMRNLVRVVVLDSVVDFLLFLGKVVIVLITGVTSYLAFAGHIPEIKDQIPSLNYIYTPVVFIIIFSYMIASSFFSVYAMAVDTLFLCFLEDLERNDGSLERPYYMSKGLKAILGKMQRVAGESRRHH